MGEAGDLCRDCRIVGHADEVAVRGWFETRVCDTCQQTYEATQRNQRYCSARCAPTGRPGNSAARGYGTEHRREKERVRKVIAAGEGWCREVVCFMPTRRIPAELAPTLMWELAHTPDRAGYRGEAHRLCNRKERWLRWRAEQGQAQVPAAAAPVITLVCGPPCSGKSTWVSQRARSSHLVVDADVIAQALGSPRTHNHHAEFTRPAEAEAQRLMAEVATRHSTAWVIRSAPGADYRRDLADDLDADRVVVLAPPRAVLVERAARRPNPAATVRLIDWWLARFTVDDGDDTTKIVSVSA